MFGIDIIARTVRGIEYVAADELATLSLAPLTLKPRQLSFRADAPFSRLTGLHTVDDVFIVVGSLSGVGHRKDVVPWLAGRVGGLDWDRALDAVAATRTLPQRRRFDVVVSLLGRRNYSRYDVEDALGTALAERLRARFVSHSGQVQGGADVHVTVRVFVSGDTATFAVRLAAGPLHRRGYKQDASRGTLHPPMAAALARLLVPTAGEVVIDPFCGDGTIPIEVAMLAPETVIHGSDIDEARVRNARANAARTGAAVSLDTADAGHFGFSDGSVDVIVTNPPWNVAVEAGGMLAGDMDRFWSQASRVLSRDGRMGLIMDAGEDVVGIVRGAGFDVALVQAVRLAGRLSQIVVCTPSGCPAWTPPTGITAWRDRAQEVRLLTDTGFESPASRR